MGLIPATACSKYIVGNDPWAILDVVPKETPPTNGKKNVYIKAWIFFFHSLAELGDYIQSENLPGYLSDYSFIPNQPQDFEKEIAKLHQQHT